MPEATCGFTTSILLLFHFAVSKIRYHARHPSLFRMLNEQCAVEQGLEAGARAQLLALSLCALEQHVGGLPESAAEATAEEWRALVGALLASCSVAAARGWLGYTPAELQAQAAALIRDCQSGAQSMTACCAMYR